MIRLRDWLEPGRLGASASCETRPLPWADPTDFPFHLDVGLRTLPTSCRSLSTAHFARIQGRVGAI